MAIPLVSLGVTPLALLVVLFVLLPAPLDALALPGRCACVAGGVARLPRFSGRAAVGEPVAAGAALVDGGTGAGWGGLAAGAAGMAAALGRHGLAAADAGLAGGPARRRRAAVTAFDIGQGTAVLVEFRDRTLPYDTGPRYSGAADAGNQVVRPYLRWRGIDRINLLVMSHLDTDHSGGAASIWGARGCGVDVNRSCAAFCWRLRQQ